MPAAENVYPKSDGDPGFASEWNFQQGNFVKLTAGENITSGNAVYFSPTDGKVYKADSSTGAFYNGVAVQTISSGSAVVVQTSGLYVTTGLTANTMYYLGTSGSITTTRNAFPIGVARTTTELYLIKQFKGQSADLSDLQTVSTSDSTGTVAITGTTANMIDRDLSTYYQNNTTIGIGTAEAVVKIDYGITIWNGIVSYKVYFAHTGATAYTAYAESSLDGSAWTVLWSQSLGSGASTTTLNGFALGPFRYLRFRFGDNGDATVRIYECRLSGVI